MATYHMKQTVEAFQMTKKRRWDNSEWPDWLNKAWNLGGFLGGVWIDQGDPKKESLVCGVAGQPENIDWDDWIVYDKLGELSLCKPGDFERNYTLVEPGGSPEK